MTEETFVAQTTFPVRYAETDAMGIVHHASYLVYFEEGRSAYTRERGRSYAELEQDGYYLIVTEAHLSYRKSLRYGDHVIVRCWISELRSRTLRFSYELINADTQVVVVTGETKHMCMTQTGDVSRFPQSWLEAMNPN